MAAACSYWPDRSSSKPWPMAWAGSERAANTSSPTVHLLLRRIQSPEILEHETALLGGETLQLLPRGITKPRARARRPGFQDVGDVHAVARRGAADALLGLVGLVVRERAAGVEQPAVQALLALDGLLVEAPGLELTRQLFRLLRERTGGGARTARLEPLELLRERALPRGESLESLQHRLATQAHHREQALSQAVQPLLIARQARQLLDRFGEPAARLAARDLTAAAGQRQRGGVERVYRVLSEHAGLGGVGIGLLELGARGRHLTLRVAQRGVELGRNERVLPGRLADLAGHRVGSLLYRRLPRPGGGARFAAAQRLGHALLPFGERGRRGERPVERRERLPAPLLRQRVALTAQRFGHTLELLLGFCSRLRGSRRPALVGSLRRALHRRPRRSRRLTRRREAGPGSRAKVLSDSVDAARQRVRAIGKRALSSGAGAVRARRVLAPLCLAAPKVLRVGRERRERALDRGPTEQLLAPLQLSLELLLRFGQPLERAARRLRVEPRQRLLQLAQPRRQLGRHCALQQLLNLTQSRLERGVVDPRGLSRAGDLLHRARQLLDPLVQRRLLPRHRLRALRRLERQRSVPRVRGAAGARRVARALLREIARPRPQLALRLGERVRRGGDVLRPCARRGPQLLEAREPQGDLAAPPHVSPGRGDIVPRLDTQPQRVARQQSTPLRVELPLNDRPLPRARHVERLSHRGPDLPGPAHAPAHDLEPGQTVIVPCVDDQRLAERQRQRRIAPRDWHAHHGRGIGHDAQAQLGCLTFERRPIRRRELELPGAGRGRRSGQPAREAGPIYGEARTSASAAPL